MYFSLDSVPDEQLTLGGAWLDDSDKENSPQTEEVSVVVPGVRQKVRGSVTAHSAITVLASSRPPVIILRRHVLAWPIRLWSVIGVVYTLCKHLKSPTHHTASSSTVLESPALLMEMCPEFCRVR